MPYTYEHPHPAVTTDVVLFTPSDRGLRVLLVRRGAPPFAGHWALPGGFVGIDESLDDCARRELGEETGIHGARVEQLGAFGAPDRDPRERVISVAYVAMIPADLAAATAGDDAAEAAWHDPDDMPPLAFDHNDIVAVARRHLAAGLDDPGFAFDALPDVFTLEALRAVHETVLGRALDDGAFRAHMLSSGLIEGLPEAAPDGGRLYRARGRGL